MTTTLRSLSTTRCCLVGMLLAAIVVSPAFARDDQPRRAPGFHMAQGQERAARRAERMQQRSMVREARPREQPLRAPPGPPEREPVQAPPAFVPQPPMQPGRPGRMTLDERRALRQQIDEAGRDVYRPRRP